MTSQEDARELIPALEGELFALSTALDDREVQLDILSELIQGEQVERRNTVGSPHFVRLAVVALRDAD